MEHWVRYGSNILIKYPGVDFSLCSKIVHGVKRDPDAELRKLTPYRQPVEAQIPQGDVSNHSGYSDRWQRQQLIRPIMLT